MDFPPILSLDEDDDNYYQVWNTKESPSNERKFDSNGIVIPSIITQG